jgi:hypothetical protein
VTKTQVQCYRRSRRKNHQNQKKKNLLFQQSVVEERRLARSDDKLKAKYLICKSEFSVKWDGVQAVTHHGEAVMHKTKAAAKNLQTIFKRF